MKRLIAALFLFSMCCLSQAETSDKYLVDFILFEHQTLLPDASEQPLIPPILLPSSTSIPLALGDYAAQPDYRNLPLSQSELRQIYYAISRNEDYRVLARYTWLQPEDNDRAVDLPPINVHLWKIQGRIKLKPGRFPFLTTNLLMTNGKQTIALRHNRALKLKQTYYLDHPKFGMIIRLTPIKNDDSETA